MTFAVIYFIENFTGSVKFRASFSIDELLVLFSRKKMVADKNPGQWEVVAGKPSKVKTKSGQAKNGTSSKGPVGNPAPPVLKVEELGICLINYLTGFLFNFV